MNNITSASTQVIQLQNSLRIVYQKLSDEKSRNDSLKYKIEEMKLKTKTQSLFKQELSGLQKKVRKLKNENKFLKIRLEVQKRNPLIRKKSSASVRKVENGPICKKKSRSMNRMSRFSHLMGRRDSFSATSTNENPSVFEERIKRKRIKIKCKELRRRVNLIRIGLGHVRKDVDRFNTQITELIERLGDQTMMFSSNVLLPEVVKMKNEQGNRIKSLEKEVQHWKDKLKKIEWKFAMKQQKMIYQLGLVDFYKPSFDSKKSGGPTTFRK